MFRFRLLCFGPLFLECAYLYLRREDHDGTPRRGDMSDVDFGDMLDYLANDRETKAILLYIEAVTHTRKFMSAARAAARMKPTIVVKAGRHAEGARAAASHTGALAGSDAVYEAVFRDGTRNASYAPDHRLLQRPRHWRDLRRCACGKCQDAKALQGAWV